MCKEAIRVTFPDVANPPPSRITYGLPFDVACAKHVKETFKAKKAYIIASKTLSEKTSFLKQLQNALGQDVVATWIGIPNHTPADSLLPIIEDVRSKQADCLITLGGGSISDGAKLINLALANEIRTLEELYTLPKLGGRTAAVKGVAKEAPKLPLICIPISLSGGEYSKWSGVTDPETHFKWQFTHDKMYPALLILDPQLTVSTPISLWLSSGVRAIDHCVEGFLSKNATPEGDAAAKRGLVDLVNGLLRTVKDPDDLEARLKCQLGGNLSMTLLELLVMKGASHGIGHQLGAMGVGHGDTSCIMLPAVCKYNAETNGDKQAQLRDLLIESNPVQQLIEDGALASDADLGDTLRAIFNAMNRPKTLKEVGFPLNKLGVLSENCLNEVYVQHNPRPITTTAEVMELLSMVKG